MRQQNTNQAELMLSICSIKLMVKFPCRMSLHHDGKPITTQVEPISNDVTIKVNQQTDVKISAYLSTGKGGSILAGLICSSVDGLSSKIGTRLNIPLQKCIDTGAVAEIKVNHAYVPHVQEKQAVNNLVSRSSAGGAFVRSGSPQLGRSKIRTQNDRVETRSQFQAQTPRRAPGVMVGSSAIIQKQKQFPQQQFQRQQQNPRDLGTNRISFKFDNTDAFEDDIRETKTIGGTGQRYRREKDKQRMEKLAAKKIADETQNNLKLDVMKYKMKSQQLQKSVTQKTKTIKQLKDQILEHQRKQIQKSFLQQQLTSKQNTIKIFEDRLHNLNTQNTNLRENIAQNLRIIGELKQNIRFDILKNKEDFMKKQQVLRVQLTQCKGKILQLELDTTNKNTQLIKAKKYIEDLESAAEHKIFEHDRLIQDLKKQQNIALKQFNQKLIDHQSKIQQLQKQIMNKNNTISQLKQSIIKYDQNTKLFQQKIQILQMQKNQLQVFKVDYQALVKKYGKLEQNFKDQQRANKKLVESKQKQFGDNLQIADKNLKSLQGKLAFSNDKIKQHKTKIQQLQTVINQFKIEQEKSKKTIQKSQKIILEHQSKQAHLQKQLKNYESQLQKLQKQLSQKSTNNTHIQSLYKIQLQHSKQNILTLNKDNDDITQKYLKNKQLYQLLKNEKIKIENKCQLQEENIGRLNQYIKEKRLEYENKQNQFKESIKNLNGHLKTMEENEKNKQKEINTWEIKDLTNRNKIDKLQRSLQECQAKIDKFEKVTIVKLTDDKQKLSQQLQQTKHKLSQALDENKFITNERVKYQSQSNKNNKINNVLNQQKLSIVAELNKAKSVIQRHEKNQQKLTVDLKAANEQNKKLTMRVENLEKEITKNREIMSETMNSIFLLKRNMKDSGEFVGYQASTTIVRGRNEGLKKKQSYIDNLASSRVLATYTGQQQLNSLPPLISSMSDIKKISQILQSTSKQQQSTIVMQQQSINHYRENLSKLQKQYSTLQFTSQATQNKLQETIDTLSTQLENAHEKMLVMTNNYEDKISKLQTELTKKQKDIKQNKGSIGSLKYELQTLRKKLEINMEQGEIKENKSGDKIAELVGECQFLEGVVKNLENEKRELQGKLYGLEEDYAIEKQERGKKEKYILELSEKWTILRVEFEDLSKIKKQNLQQLLALREQAHALREANEKTQQMLKNQQKNNKKLQDFINDLIKQKQNIVKVELQSSSKAIQMQGTVLQMKNILDNKDEQLKQKQQIILQSKSTIKTYQNDVKNLQHDLKQCNSKITTLNNKIQQKQKKIIERDNELKQTKNQYTINLNKNKQQMRILREQYQQLQRRSQSRQEQKDTKIFNLQKHITELQSQIQSLSTELTHKQQLIFFEKQRASLLDSAITDLKKGQSQISLIISKYQTEINQLNQELTYKEETLYEYSGKIYQLQQKLEAKDVEIGIREEKVDVDWQCRHDQICEEYEQKIQVLEKDKKYLKQKLDSAEQQKIRILSEKQKILSEIQKDVGTGKAKQKLLEQQKLQIVNHKNKQIDGYKNQIALLNNQVKNCMIEVKKKQNQIINKDEAIKKLQIRIHENDRGSGSLKKQYQQEINNMKKNQNMIKGLKEEIKNAQWVTEREVKKITQIFIQKVVNCFPEGKEKLVEPIRAMESSMSNVINFKI